MTLIDTLTVFTPHAQLVIQNVPSASVRATTPLLTPFELV